MAYGNAPQSQTCGGVFSAAEFAVCARAYHARGDDITAPNPLPNAEFMRDLRRAWGARVGLPATEWMLELGAIALQTETDLVLKSRRVVPGTLLRSGFTFAFPDWASAASELCEQWRGLRRRTDT